MSEVSSLPTEISLDYLQAYNGYKLFVVAVFFIVLEPFCVILRFWARKLTKATWGLDDFMIIPGLLLCISLSIWALLAIKHGGVGFHEITLAMSDPRKVMYWAKGLLILPELYVAAIFFPKVAILALFLRIFTQKPYRTTVYLLMIILTANWVATAIAAALACVPIWKLWMPTIPGHCFNVNAYLRWGTLINIITDVIMFILPLPVVWKLNTTINMKIGLSLTFATGGLGLVTSIIRFASFFNNNADKDGTWTSSDLISWTICEPGVHLIAACLPTYRPLAKRAREISSSSLHSFTKIRSRNAREGQDEIPLSRRWEEGPKPKGPDRDTPQSDEDFIRYSTSKDDMHPGSHLEHGQIPIDFTETNKSTHGH